MDILSIMSVNNRYISTINNHQGQWGMKNHNECFQKFIDFRLSRWLTADISSVVEWLYRVSVDSLTNVSDIYIYIYCFNLHGQSWHTCTEGEGSMHLWTLTALPTPTRCNHPRTELTFGNFVYTFLLTIGRTKTVSVTT
jgi:hypothetical protein